MIIRYSDGRAHNAVLLARTENTIRAAVEGADDVMEFSNINGAWISPDWEPVMIVFEWQRHDRKKAVPECDSGFSDELAGRMIHLLFAGSSAA